MVAYRIPPEDLAKRVSLEEYFTLEEQSDERYEFDDGVITAMSGASIAHGLITQSIAHHLQNGLMGRKCSVVSQGTRVSIPSVRRYYYPDVAVVCGRLQIERQRGESLLNPILVVEVLSPSTNARDRGEKLRRYQSIQTLQYYLLVDPTEPFVTLYRRDGEAWIYATASGLDASLELVDIECTLRLADIYEQVEFASEDDEGIA
jgi:Uma2 family endonuclease